MNPEIQKILQPEPQPSQSTRAVRKFVIFILIIIAVIILIFLLAEYDRQQNAKAVDMLNQTILDIQKADYEEAMKDTYGGKTPQETLSLYISAIEKGDYELASKYFIGTRQQKELESWKNVDENKKISYLGDMRKLLVSNGEYYEDDKRFQIRKPFYIDFKQYPNGIWKIIEI